MMHSNDSNKIEHVYEILRTYGPATAMDYMQHTSGGLHSFPPTLLMQVHVALKVQQHTHRAVPINRKRKPILD